MNKTSILLLLAALLLLVSCGVDNAETAVNYLEALNQRDLDTARDLVCEARQDDVTMGLTTVDDPQMELFSFNDVSCTARGGDVLCRFTIEQITESAETTGIERSREVIFAFEGGKVCGFEEQVAQ